MYKLVLLALASISLIGCGSESSLEDKSSSNAETPGLGSAIGTDSGSLSDSVPTSYVNLKAAVRLEPSVDYTWSVRARTNVGYGEWSAGLEFSIHPSEDLALADAIAKDDSVEDYDAGLYSDALPVPTVISSSPVGSLVNAQPTFKWDPVSDAISYEVRVMQVDSDIQVFTDTYTALDVCQNNACELPSTPEEATQTPIAVTDNNGTPTTNVDPDSPEPELTPAVEVTTPPVVEVVPEVEVNTPVAEVEPEVEAETPVVEVEPEVEAETPVVEVETPVVEVIPEVEVDIDTPVVEVLPEVEVETPVVEVLPEEEVETPDPEEENNVPDTNQLPVANAAENPEIEALQQSEGVLAFPGALGYAKNALGGRGGRVVVVNTVSNTVNASDNLMSLREATTVETGPRTIVFAVGGVFDAGDAELIMSGEADSNVTVACQSAPAPGVTIKTYGFALQNGAHDIIFRHCAVRLISVNSTRARAGRTVTVRGGSRNIMLDHMSFAWATDENFQAYLAPGEAVGIENVTVSNSAVVEGDADSAHPESVEHHSWFYHAMGPSCNNNNPSSRITGCSIVNNFIAHNSTRNAMIWGGDGELKNNIIYNWYGIGLTVQPHDGGDVSAIIDNNLMKSGPDTKGGTSNPNCGPAQYRCAMYLGKTNFRGTSRFLVGNNYYIPEYKTFDDVVLIDHQNANTPAGTPLFDSATDSPIPVLDMAARGSRFMACVGASRPERDHIDTRVIEEFYNGTGSIGIGENNRAGGHNQNIQRTWHLFGPNTTHPAGYDTDNDGMPNEWEIAYGLDPNNANDHAGDIDSDGYTNLEEYLAIAAHC